MKKSAGFTLLEVIIAVALFAIISLSATGLLSTVLDSQESSKLRNQQMNELQRAFLVMERDFIQMTRRRVRLEGEAPLEGFIHTNESTYSSNTHGIAFVRKGWRNPALMLPRSDVQAVAYQLDGDVFNRLHYVFADPVVGTEPKSRPLISNVLSVDFEFYNGKKWVKELPDDDLPLAVAIDIEIDDYGTVRRQFLVPGVTKSGATNVTQ